MSKSDMTLTVVQKKQ